MPFLEQDGTVTSAYRCLLHAPCYVAGCHIGLDIDYL